MTKKYIQLRDTLLRDIAEHEGWDNPTMREELEEYLAADGSNADNNDYFINHANA